LCAFTRPESRRGLLLESPPTWRHVFAPHARSMLSATLRPCAPELLCWPAPDRNASVVRVMAVRGAFPVVWKRQQKPVSAAAAARVDVLGQTQSRHLHGSPVKSAFCGSLLHGSSDGAPLPEFDGGPPPPGARGRSWWAWRARSGCCRDSGCFEDLEGCAGVVDVLTPRTGTLPRSMVH
jgi:hypothetical protein